MLNSKKVLLFNTQISRNFPVPPQISPFSFGEAILNRGELTSVVCNVPKGDLPLNIHWTLNSEPIQSGQDGFMVMQMNSRTSYLSIDSLQDQHRGIYRCVAVNMAGLDEYAAELQVNGVCLFLSLILISNYSKVSSVNRY